MSISWLVYVSDAMIPTESDLTSLVGQAQSRNLALEITGSLIFTGTKFAQFLEGSAAALDVLMTDIRTDPRHSNVVVVAEGTQAERQFPNWSLTYAGPAMYVERVVESSLPGAADDSPTGARKLIRLMHELTAQHFTPSSALALGGAHSKRSNALA